MSTEPLNLEHERSLLRDLLQAVAQRAGAESALSTDHGDRSHSEQGDYDEGLKSLERQLQEQIATIHRQYDRVVQEHVSECDAEVAATQIEYDDRLLEVQTRHDSDHAEAVDEFAEADWLVAAVLDDTGGTNPKHRFETFKNQLQISRVRRMSQWEELTDRVDATALLLGRWRQWREFEAPVPEVPPEDLEECLERFVSLVERANSQLDRLHALWLPRLFAGRRPLWLWLAGTLVTTAVMAVLDLPLKAGLEAASRIDSSLAISTATGGVLSAIGLALLLAVTRVRSGRLWRETRQHVADARRTRQFWLQSSKQEYGRRQGEFRDWYRVIIEERDNALTRIKEARTERFEEIRRQRDEGLAEANSSFPARLEELQQQRVRTIGEAESERREQLSAAARVYRLDREAHDQQHQQRTAVEREQVQRTFKQLADGWEQGWSTFCAGAGKIAARCNECFPDFVEFTGDRFRPAEVVPPALRFGRYTLDLASIHGGLSSDERLRPDNSQVELPALLPFPEAASLLIEADGEGRTAAVEALQMLMLRLLASLPPGKLRFTIIDPVGLGDNFSAFMHLADYDERLVSGRIWTESAHIDQQLANLTEHMEDVFQTYLRSQFKTLEEYNAYAGEVAEPYHVLVVANFPANFSDTAVRRLVSIASSGARCGVFTLVSIDSRQQVPHNFDLADLRQHATGLSWHEGRFICQDPDFAWMPLEIDRPPEADVFMEIVKRVGEVSKDARRVEVPFGRIAPAEGDRWSQDSRHGLDVPLGRAGATKLQWMRLGPGTSQHVMVAGKTGSGKSSFLHTLITNLALHYAPDQVEFYLIDFKKGVEFKTYVTNSLPHARVIAIESDREFGLSVLEHLDSLLEERGGLFRQHHVQDIAGFRDACPDQPLPRVLLIIDEFQEFFVEDDRVHQGASLLLDRLIRQGRAFGIHVLLGSQTLGGAYSLARSTLGQVAVRVALQCSEADAHLILSEENTAARLLSRPGEAIYNDANGLLEGNHPFQIAWLSEDRREEHLTELAELAEERGLKIPPAVVFEGNLPADPRHNRQLEALFADVPIETPAAAPVAWLGDAVRITGPVSIRFRRQSGNNLLVVGQSPSEAQGLLATALAALSVQFPADHPVRFAVLDGSPSDLPTADSWQKLADVLPHPVELIGPRKVAGLLAEIAEEVARRDREDDETAPPIYLVLFNLGRFRDLRRDDDDYGFGADKPASPGQSLAGIIRDGPALGVHLLCWCDTYNNVVRAFSNSMLRDIELRVAFQMNGSDSSNLVDSPAASQLGIHRGLLFLAEHGSLEKFRPYGPPTDEWIDELRLRLAGQHGGEVASSQ